MIVTWLFVVCLATVCRGTSSGIASSTNIEAAYEQYVNTYTNCTYIDGNVELVFITDRNNYDLSFLKVLLLVLTGSYHLAQLSLAIPPS